MRAQGHFMVFLSSLLERLGAVVAGELVKLLQLYADVVSETELGEAPSWPIGRRWRAARRHTRRGQYWPFNLPFSR